MSCQNRPLTPRQSPPSRSVFPRTLLSLSMCAAVMCIPTPGEATTSHEKAVLSLAEEAAVIDLMLANSPHRLALEYAKSVHGDGPDGNDQATTFNPLAPPPPPPKALAAKPGRRMYGFLPYWTMKNAKLHWAGLTQVAYFAAELKSNGTFASLHGWGGLSAKALIAQAHANGVQVPLTVTLFDKAGIGVALATAAKRTALINKLTDLVISGGGDGINIDFEGLAKADRDKMKAFVTELSKKMHQKLPDSDVTLATPPVDWNGAWDYDYLAENCDGLFIMAYGVHYTGSNPGPQLPMANGKPWSHQTLQWIVDDYMQWGKAVNKHKFIVGLPLYGNSWLSSDGQPGATKLAKGTAKTMEAAVAEAPKYGGFKWNPASKSTWYGYKNGSNWQQIWVEDAKSLDLRIDYVAKRDVQLGLWALGYADKLVPVWTSLKAYVAAGTSSPGTPTDAGSSDTTNSPDAGGGDDAKATADAGGTSDSTTTFDGGSQPKDSKTHGDVATSVAKDSASGALDVAAGPGDVPSSRRAQDSAAANPAQIDAIGDSKASLQAPADGKGGAAVVAGTPARSGGCQATPTRSASALSLLVLGIVTLLVRRRRAFCVRSNAA